MKVACVGIFEARQRKKKKREVEKGQQKLTRHSQECKQPFEKKKGGVFFFFCLFEVRLRALTVPPAWCGTPTTTCQ
jgi:hypothetical protein